MSVMVSECIILDDSSVDYLGDNYMENWLNWDR